MAKGVLDPFSPQSLPAAGLQRAGAELANITQLAEADLVIAIGYDLVEWAPSLWNPKRDKVVIHVDSTAPSSMAITSRRSRWSASSTSRSPSSRSESKSGRTGLSAS